MKTNEISKVTDTASSKKCQDSGAQVLRPVEDGMAWCGCCGGMVTIIIRFDDSNQIPFYTDHVKFNIA